MGRLKGLSLKFSEGAVDNADVISSCSFRGRQTRMRERRRSEEFPLCIVRSSCIFTEVSMPTEHEKILFESRMFQKERRFVSICFRYSQEKR